MEFSTPELQWPDSLDAQRFLQHYWQQKPLLWRNAIKDFENPISPDELGGLALDEDIPSRIILKQDELTWHCRFGPFEEKELTELPASDWSLLVTDVEKYLPEFKAWLSAFNFIPEWRIDDLMISYAPQGASVGAHTDNYDVFLFQAAGQREWSIDSSGTSDLAFIPDLDVRILADFTANETFILEPGDMLYLPPGVPHHGVSLDNDCMTWSIGFRAPSHREVIQEMSNSLLETIAEDDFYRDPPLTTQTDNAEILPQAIERLKDIWVRHTQPDAQTFARLAGELLTGGQAARDTESESQPETEHSDTDILSSKHWERSSHSRWAFIRLSTETTEPGKEQSLIFVDGRTFTCTSELARLLTNQSRFDAEVLTEFCRNNDNKSLLNRLCINGSIIPAAEG